MKNTTQVRSLRSPAEDFVITFLIDQKNGKEEDILSFKAPGATAIDWGDGCVDEVTDSNEFDSHIYAESGVYDVRIMGDLDRFDYYHAISLIEIKQWGNSQWTDVESMFLECVNMTMSATDAPDLSKVEDMTRMFYHCRKFNAPIEHWDTKGVRFMTGMLERAHSFNQPLAKLDFKAIESVFGMLEGASAFDQDLRNFTPGVDTYSLFGYGKSLADYNEKYDVREQQQDVYSVLDGAGACRVL